MAIHKPTGGIFALKRVPKSVIKEAMMIDQFALEVRIQASFNDPNIVSVYAVFDDREHVYLLLEYLPGGSLYG
jgi:serine/threonine protein kinase